MGFCRCCFESVQNLLLADRAASDRLNRFSLLLAASGDRSIVIGTLTKRAKKWSF
jgi:hypothetical protein